VRESDEFFEEISAAGAENKWVFSAVEFLEFLNRCIWL